MSSVEYGWGLKKPESSDEFRRAKWYTKSQRNVTNIK